MRQPPPATGIAAQEGRTRYRRRLHVSPASRTQGLCLNRNASCVTQRPLQRSVILHKEIHFSHIEPESVSGGTDIESGAMARWNLSQVFLTIGTFHGNHRIQTVARIGQVSTQCASNRLEKQGVQQGYQRVIMTQCASDESCGRDSRLRIWSRLDHSFFAHDLAIFPHVDLCAIYPGGLAKPPWRVSGVRVRRLENVHWGCVS